MPLSAALASCVALAAANYGVPAARIESVMQAAHPSSQRVGVMGIPAQWMPYLQHYGFNPEAVQTNACANIIAGAWILAYTDRLNSALETAKANHVPEKAKAWQPLINWVAEQAQVSPALINAVIEQESGYNPVAISSAGAVGLMQIMPFNAKAWHINPFNPAQNVWAGTWHLKYLMQKYSGNVALALAAYNAGSRAVDKYGGIPPFPETRNYVPAVLARYARIASAN